MRGTLRKTFSNNRSVLRIFPKSNLTDNAGAPYTTELVRRTAISTIHLHHASEDMELKFVESLIASFACRVLGQEEVELQMWAPVVDMLPVHCIHRAGCLISLRCIPGDCTPLKSSSKDAAFPSERCDRIPPGRPPRRA